MVKLRRQRLDMVCRKFAKHQGLPFGSQIEIRRDRGKGRMLRGDMTVHRRPFGKQLDGEKTVSAILQHMISCIENPDLQEIKVGAILKSPEGNNVSPQTLLRTVQGWEGLPTPEEIEQAESEEARIQNAEVEHQFLLEEQQKDWNAEGPGRAATRALVKKYGVKVVRSWIDELEGQSILALN